MSLEAGEFAELLGTDRAIVVLVLDAVDVIQVVGDAILGQLPAKLTPELLRMVCEANVVSKIFM